MDDKVENVPNGAIPHTVGIFTTQVVQCLAWWIALSGAVCFLVASYLWIPELFGADKASSPPGNQSPKQS